MAKSTSDLPVLRTGINPGIEVSAALVYDMPPDAKPALMVFHDR
jgi:hypothetical protein